MANIMLPYEGKRLVIGSSYEDKTSEIRTSHLSVIKWSPIMSFNVLSTYRLGWPFQLAHFRQATDINDVSS